MMRVAALYDIHGNLPALEAVLQDIRQADVDQIVVGGDVVPGPMPRETLRRLLDLDLPTHFIYGNGELAILAQMAGTRTGSVTYWGTTSGARPPESIIEIYHWTAAQLQSEFEPVLARWPKTLQLEIDGLGQVLFCHSTPRSETECFTRLTAEDRLLPLFELLQVAMVVCGHTHMQFDRRVGRTRVVNAGSVGAPFGEPGAYWLLLGPDVQLRRTLYDFTQAAERIRGTEYPQAEDFAVQSVLTPPSEEKMLEVFTPFELINTRGEPMPNKTTDPAESAFPKGVANPALRALASVGVTRLDQVTRLTESQLRALHGMGPKAIEAIKTALHTQGKSLAKDE